MKSSRRIEQRIACRRQTPRRHRRLVLEQLETRDLLCYGNPPLYDPPPDSYRSDNVSDDLARVAYEFDRWVAEPLVRDFMPTDCEVLIRNGRVYIQALAVNSAADLISELASIDVEVVGNYKWAVVAWVPLTQLNDLKDVQELMLAGIPFLYYEHGQTAADVQVYDPVFGDDVRTVSGSVSETSQNLVPPFVAEDYADVPVHFRSSRVSDLLSRGAFESSQRPLPLLVSDFVVGDPWVTVKEGFSLIQAVSASVSGEQAGVDLTEIGGNVRGSFSSEVSDWLPLQRIREREDLVDLTFASPILDCGLTDELNLDVLLAPAKPAL